MTTLDPAEIFRQEASELFDVLEAALLDLGLRPDDKELVDQAFRALHTIKGSGAMFGFDEVASFTHEFETAFDRVRKGEIKPDQDLISVALAAKDYIRALIEAPETTDSIIGDGILADLRRLVEPAHADELPGQDPAAIAAPAAVTAEVRTGWQLHLEFDTDILRNGSNPLDLLDDLGKLGACFVVALTEDVPFLDELDPEHCFLKWDVTLHSGCERDAIDDVFIFVQDEMKLVCTPILAAEAAPPLAPMQSQNNDKVNDTPSPLRAVAAVQEATAAPQAEKRREEPRRADDKANATVRVQAERLDELMDRVGELVIAQARLSQLASATDDISIKAIAEEIERLAASLRDTTMGARMVPIGSLFGRFRRLVHDLSRDLRKPVEFVTSGEDTELDKTMIERLADPLVHLIRNAIDHGIEDTASRTATGKTDIGRIEIAATHYWRPGAGHRPRQRRGPQYRPDSGESRRAGPDRAGRGDVGRRHPSIPVSSRLLHRPGGFRIVRPRGRHGRGQAHHRGHARFDRHFDGAGQRHHGDAASAADARHHRGAIDPGWRRPLHHSALGGGRMHRAVGRRPARTRTQFPEHARRPGAVPAAAGDVRRRGRT
jgi:two-component system chemotaxis sensor kinase CheA